MNIYVEEVVGLPVHIETIEEKFLDDGNTLQTGTSNRANEDKTYELEDWLIKYVKDHLNLKINVTFHYDNKQYKHGRNHLNAYPDSALIHFYRERHVIAWSGGLCTQEITDIADIDEQDRHNLNKIAELLNTDFCIQRMATLVCDLA